VYPHRNARLLQAYGKNWKMVASAVKTRSLAQIRSHAQKFFQKHSWARELYGSVKEEESLVPPTASHELGGGGGAAAADAAGGAVTGVRGAASGKGPTANEAAAAPSGGGAVASALLAGVTASVVGSQDHAFAGGAFTAYVVRVQEDKPAPVVGQAAVGEALVGTQRTQWTVQKRCVTPLLLTAGRAACCVYAAVQCCCARAVRCASTCHRSCVRRSPCFSRERHPAPS
jgi:hypothetical protein